MLRQLSSSHDNGQSIVIYRSCEKYAPSVVIVSWQRSEHGKIPLMYETCSDCCHRLMKTDRAWLFICKIWNMLSQLSSSHNIGQSMVIYHSCMKHTPSVVIVKWKRSEHSHISLRNEACSFSCHRLMTTVRAGLYIMHILNMLSFVMLSWQRSEHGDIYLKYETCSISCHRLMTTAREWLFIHKVWNMLRLLSSSHDNGQSMVIYPSSMIHAPSVMIVSWQRSEHGNISLMYEDAPSDVVVSWQRTDHGYSSLRYETCSVSCHRLMTTVKAW